MLKAIEDGNLEVVEQCLQEDKSLVHATYESVRFEMQREIIVKYIHHTEKAIHLRV